MSRPETTTQLDNGAACSVQRSLRQISERDLAMALVLEFAESGLHEFSLLGFYDNDADFVDGLAKRLGVDCNKPFHNKLTRVVRRLVAYGVLYGQMRSTYKEYIGAPTKQMNYAFTNPGKARLLTRGETAHTGTPEWEASFLLRHAYPKPDDA